MKKGRRKLTVHLGDRAEILSVIVQNDKRDYFRIYDRYPFAKDKLPLSEASMERIKRLVAGRISYYAVQQFAGYEDRYFNNTFLIYEWNDPQPPAHQPRTITVSQWYDEGTRIAIENRREQIEYGNVTASSLYRIERLLAGMEITRTYLTLNVLSVTAHYKGE